MGQGIPYSSIVDYSPNMWEVKDSVPSITKKQNQTKPLKWVRWHMPESSALGMSVPSQPQLHSELETSLGIRKPYYKKTKGKKRKKGRDL